MATKTKSVNAMPVFSPELPTFDPEPPTIMEGTGLSTTEESAPECPVMPPAPECPTEPITPEPKTEKLTGEALLAYATERKGQDLTQDELALGAGYVTRARADGALKPAPRAYSSALAVAAGLVPAQASAGTRAGRPLTFKVSSNVKSGNVQIPGNYLVELGASFGTKFVIIVDREAGELVLQKCEEEDGKIGAADQGPADSE